MNKKKNIWNVVFLLVVFALTIYLVFKGEDMGEMYSYIRKTKIRYWVLAIICVILFIESEAFIIYYMMRALKQGVKLTHCFLYSFVGFFFSCITPSATGGQPAQIYYMKKDDLPIPISTLVLIIVTLTYKFVLVLLGGVVFLIRPQRIMMCLKPVIGLCYFGWLLNAGCVIFMVLLVVKPQITHNMITALINLLSKMHLIRKKERVLERFDRAMIQYKDVAGFFVSHKLVVLNVLLITLLQRFLLFFVGYLAYRSFGLKQESMITLVILQGMISVAVDMLPLPGGMGISEKMFLLIFAPVFGSVTLPAMVISRGLSYYTELLISAIMTVVTHLCIGRERKGKKRNDRIL